MKQEVYANGQRTSSTPVPGSTRYHRPTPRTKDNPTTDSPNVPNVERHKSVSSVSAPGNNAVRRSINFNRVRPVPVLPVPVPVSTDEDKCKELQKRLDLSENSVKELQKRVDASDNSVKELQGEVSELRTYCQRLRGANSELDAQKKRLEAELTAAREKIRQLEIIEQKRAFQDLQKAAEKKLQIPNKFEEATKQAAISVDHKSNIVQTQTKATNSTIRRPFPPPPPPPPVTGRPPPPPPPPHQHSSSNSNRNAVHKASALVELYNSMTKQNGKKDQIVSGSCSSPIGRNPQSNILGELQNRSAHLLAIKSDVETKGDFIRSLIEKVQSAAYTKMEDVLKFVDWIDRELSTLSDERAVLKHFNWPERKADSLREAAIEFRYFKSLQSEIDSFKDDTSTPCDASLRKISSLLDKLEKGMERLIRLRSSNMVSYRDCKIPTDWLQESGMVSKMKLASVKLAKLYMKRVARELDSARNMERETVHESLLFQGVRFAYRVHQFAGGLDTEAMSAFEELRDRIRAQEHGSGSKELLPGVMLSR